MKSNRVLPLYSFDSVEKIVHRLRPSPDVRNDLLEIRQQLAEVGNPNAGGLELSSSETFKQTLRTAIESGASSHARTHRA